jgi:Domain of unknown function (DUF4160)
LGKVSAFSIDGLICLFYSNDHRPPHFHIKKAGCWEIRVYFLSCTKNELDYSVKFSKNSGSEDVLMKKERKAILQMVMKHRDALLNDGKRRLVLAEND